MIRHFNDLYSGKASAPNANCKEMKCSRGASASIKVMASEVGRAESYTQGAPKQPRSRHCDFAFTTNMLRLLSWARLSCVPEDSALPSRSRTPTCAPSLFEELNRLHLHLRVPASAALVFACQTEASVYISPYMDLAYLPAFSGK